MPRNLVTAKYICRKYALPSRKGAEKFVVKADSNSIILIWLILSKLFSLKAHIMFPGRF